jgi:hypothetical protein
MRTMRRAKGDGKEGIEVGIYFKYISLFIFQKSITILNIKIIV